MVDDEELVREIKTGSEAAMEVLTRRYYKTIFAFVYRKTGDRELAADMTQDVFIKMMKKIMAYSDKGSFRSWLFTITVNHCRDYWRSRAYRMSGRQTRMSEDLIGRRDDDVPFIFEQKETRKAVVAAIGQLPEEQKDVVLLRFYHEMKIREIAEVVGVGESTVKSRLRQGLRKLRIFFKRGGSEDEAATRD